MSKAKLKNWTKPIGWSLSALCLVYVISTFHKHWHKLPELQWSYPLVFFCILLIAIWILNQFLYSYQWKYLLQLCYIDIHPAHAFWMFCRTQIAKYLPLNVFHFAGRVYLAKSDNRPSMALSYSILMEAGIFVLVSASLGIPGLLPLDSLPIRALATIILGLVSIGSCLLAYSVSNGRFLKQRRLDSTSSALLFSKSFLLLACSFIINAIAAYGLLCALTTSEPVSFPLFLSVFSLAWGAGYAVPGAPGGLGVREAVFTFVIPSSHDVAPYLVLIVLFRLTSILGDVLIFLISHLYKPKGYHT